MPRAILILMVLQLANIPSQAAPAPELIGLMSDLFAEGGYGRLPTERAAFLVVRADGSIECQAWPAGVEFQSARFSGRVPPGTIAVMHTHPNERREPSRIDRELARRLNVPVLVVTRASVTVAAPGSGEVETLVEGDWARRPISGDGCRSMQTLH